MVLRPGRIGGWEVTDMYCIPSKYLIMCVAFVLLFSHMLYLSEAIRFSSVKDLQKTAAGSEGAF